MTDRTLLQRYITESGLKKGYIADQLGISIQALRLKLMGSNEFKEREIQTLSEVLNMDSHTRERVFFSQNC